MLAPVIQRAASDAKNATTSATSSGLPIRFNACIASVTSRPASVFVKFRHIRVNYSWCDSIYAYAARPENGGPILDQSLNCSLGRGVSENRRIFQTGLAHYRTGYNGRDHNDVRAFT